MELNKNNIIHPVKSYDYDNKKNPLVIQTFDKNIIDYSCEWIKSGFSLFVKIDDTGFHEIYKSRNLAYIMQELMNHYLMFLDSFFNKIIIDKTQNLYENTKTKNKRRNT